MAARPLPRLEVRVLEANAVARGVPVEALMEAAGKAVAEEARRHLPSPGAPVGIVCGGGNNGGDGFAAAHHLVQAGFHPKIWFLGTAADLKSVAARRMWERVATSPGVIHGAPRGRDLSGLALVIDAMIGTGGRGELAEPYRSAVAEILTSRVPVLSIDLPTGLGTSSPLVARWTVALEVRKEGMDVPACGEVSVRSLGIPPEAYRETGPGEFALFPRPHDVTHKGAQGRLVVVGGGPYTGAPALAAMAALRAGVDMAFVVTPMGVADIVQGYSPEIIVRGVGHGRLFHEEESDTLWNVVHGLRPDALLIGNGLGTDPSTLAGIEELLEAALPHLPVVLDADALRVLTHRSEHPFPHQEPRRLLATPNLREFAHLGTSRASSAEEHAEETVRKVAQELGVTLLVKGPQDVISDGTDLKVNRTHHPAMVVGGAGDTLAGVVASLVARGLSPYAAGRLGSYWVGRASVRLFPRLSYGLLPRDLQEELPGTLAEGLAAVDPDPRAVKRNELGL